MTRSTAAAFAYLNTQEHARAGTRGTHTHVRAHWNTTISGCHRQRVFSFFAFMFFVAAGVLPPGPGRNRDGDRAYGHWFDGDGHVAKVR